MVEINSIDYHDYVIKNGKLIGEFEQMYQKAKNIPWHQNKQENWIDIRIIIELLKEYSPFDSITDFGCGLGYFLEILKKFVGTPSSRAIGYDISPTCCKKASEIFPQYEFHVLDLMSEPHIYNTMQDKTRQDKTRQDLCAIRGTLWYIFPKMRNVVKNIANMMKNGNILLVSQNFPPLESSFVGKEIIPSPESIVEWFGNYFTSLKTCWLQDRISKGNDNWFVGIFRRGDK